MKSFFPQWQHLRCSRYAIVRVGICLLRCDRPDVADSAVKSLLPQEKDHQQSTVNTVTNFASVECGKFLV